MMWQQLLNILAEALVVFQYYGVFTLNVTQFSWRYETTYKVNAKTTPCVANKAKMQHSLNLLEIFELELNICDLPISVEILPTSLMSMSNRT